MTCGMLCVVRSERRGLVHLDKYSPPKEIFSVEREEKKKKKRKKKDNEKEREQPVL